MTWKSFHRTTLLFGVSLSLWGLAYFQYRYLLPFTSMVLAKWGVDPHLHLNNFMHVFGIPSGILYAVGGVALLLGLLVRLSNQRRWILIYLPLAVNVFLHFTIYLAQFRLAEVLAQAKL